MISTHAGKPTDKHFYRRNPVSSHQLNIKMRQLGSLSCLSKQPYVLILNMIDAYAPDARHSLVARASVISEAHHFLLALAYDQTPTQPLSTAALDWLCERQLIDEVLDDAGLSYEISSRGRQAVLGKQTVAVWH